MAEESNQNLAAKVKELARDTQLDENDKNIEQWKIKKLIKSLEAARG